MSYFLKKSNLKKGVYLQIYESYYDPVRKGGAHRSYMALGYVDALKEKGIEDPIAYYGEEVQRLNEAQKQERHARKAETITEQSPERLLGYFLLKSIHEGLGIKPLLDLLQAREGYRFNVYQIMSALVYARVVNPCSKLKTYDEVFPKMLEETDFSLTQVYSALEYLGREYERIIAIYSHQVNEKYRYNTEHTYFDCTNFYFEIDREDDFRRKGPSKENRREPIVGLGLLLDANQIPLGMKVYPGNASEKPVMREIIDDLKKHSNITGRTIQVADKGLNCAENIVHALQAKDGYLFSKSVKTLPEVEKAWVLNPEGYREVKDSAGKVLYKIKSCVDEFPYKVRDAEGREITVRLPEKRVVTFNPSLAEKQKYEIDREVEKARKLQLSQAKRSEYGDCSRFVSFVPTDSKGKRKDDGKVKVIMNEEAIRKAKNLAGYNLLVTSELNMSDGQIYCAYHNLWRIEESFRVMKSFLDARPVFLQKRESIIGHFLICYLSVLFLRLLQFKTLDNKFSSENIFAFMTDFRVAKISSRSFLNLTTKSNLTDALSCTFSLPVNKSILSLPDINKLLNHRF